IPWQKGVGEQVLAALERGADEPGKRRQGSDRQEQQDGVEQDRFNRAGPPAPTARAATGCEGIRGKRGHEGSFATRIVRTWNIATPAIITNSIHPTAAA